MFLPRCASLPPCNEDQRGLQSRAASSLCELSDYICADPTTQRTSAQPERVGCSPWKLKKDHIRKEILPDKFRKRSTHRHDPRNTNYPNRSLVTEDKENLPPGRPEDLCQNRLRKFPSVFARLMAARQARNALPKDHESDTEIFAILRKKQAHSQIKKIALRERNENFSLNAKKTACEEPALGSRCRTVKLARSEPEENADESRIVESWKARHASVKGKARRPTLPTEHENISLTRKGTISLQRKYDEQYQSRNPLTRLLYEKLINTISMTSSAKEGRYRLIVNAFIN